MAVIGTLASAASRWQDGDLKTLSNAEIKLIIASIELNILGLSYDLILQGRYRAWHGMGRKLRITITMIYVFPKIIMAYYW